MDCGCAARIEDHNGALWFGTDNQGVVRVASGKGHAFHASAEGLRNNGIQSFYEDRNRHLWIGTTSGLSRWDGSRFTNYYLEQGLSYGWVRAIAEDHNGDMLVGTDRGLNRFHDGRFASDPAFARARAATGSGPSMQARRTPSGSARGAPGWCAYATARRRGSRHGKVCSTNSVFQVIGDGGGRLWMSGPLGLSSASLAELNSVADGGLDSVAVLSYGTGDGLDSTQINGGVQPAGCLATDGELWFPSVKGAVHFRPDPPRNGPHSPVRVESVLVDDQTLPASGEVTVAPGQAARGDRFHARRACARRSA